MGNRLARQRGSTAARQRDGKQLFYRKTFKSGYNKLFLAFFIFALLPVYAHCASKSANTPADAEASSFSKATQDKTADMLYKDEKFDRAFKIYKRKNIAEPDNPYTLHNMGNCQFRMNNYGLSVLYYAKAFNLLPRNADIRHNLKFAMNQTGQKLIQDGTPVLLHKLFYFFALSELKAMTYIVFWILCLLLSVAVLKRDIRTKIWPPFIYLIAVFAVFFIWGATRADSRFENAAVIMESDTPILSGPGKNFKTYASLPAGRIVKISDIPGSAYIQIGLPEEGLQGWVEKTAFKKI